jgi:hypothetical protein
MSPPPSSSLAEERTPPLASPPCDGARFPTLAAVFLSCSRIALCLIARSARVRIAPGSAIRCSIARCRLRRCSLGGRRRRRSPRELRLRSLLALLPRQRSPAWLRTAARDPLFHRSLPLAAMFAGRPPSSPLIPCSPPLGHNVTGPAVAGPVTLMDAAASSALVPQKCVETWGVAGTTAETWSIFSLRLLALLTSNPI